MKRSVYRELSVKISFNHIILYCRGAGDSSDETVTVEKPNTFESQGAVSALLALGFQQVSSDSKAIYLLPCPLGTFSNFSSRGTDGCTTCPPGIFHLD